MKKPWQPDSNESFKTGEPIHDHWVDTFVKMRDEMGPEQFNEFAINLAKAEEAGLRERIPNHPLLKLLDAHRSREANGFF